MANKTGYSGATSGVTYYKLDWKRHGYEGDYTKNCGLTGTEIDANFHFLRGQDIKNLEISGDSLVITFVEPSKIIVVPEFGEYISNTINESLDELTLSGSTYNPTEGTLTLYLNDKEYEIGGFLTKENIGVYVANGLKGEGNPCNPLRLSEVEETGVFEPVDTFIDYAVSPSLESGDYDYDKEQRYLTKEKYSKYGVKYNFEGIQEIQRLLDQEQSLWRIPTFIEWGEMLNGLETCDETKKQHLNSEINSWNGEDAGFCAKDDDWHDSPLGNNSINIVPSEDTTAVLWSQTETDNNKILTKKLSGGTGLVQTVVFDPEEYHVLRLIRDVKCNGLGGGVATILGIPYETVQMQHDNGSGETIARFWTKTNISTLLSNNEWYEEFEGKTNGWRYFINEYDHILNIWTKKELKENCSVILKAEISGRTNEELIVQNGKLAFKRQALFDLQDEISILSGGTFSGISGEIRARISGDTALGQRIDKEIEDRTTADNALGARIDREINDRTAADNALSARIDKEIQDREDAINEEAQTRQEEDERLEALINEEKQERVSGDTAINQRINNVITSFETQLAVETAQRQSGDTILSEAIEAEKQERIEADEQLENRISNVQSALTQEIETEAEERAQEDDKIWQALSGEVTTRSETDQILSGKVEDIFEILDTISGGTFSGITELVEELRELSGSTVSAITNINDLSAATESGLSQLDNKIGELSAATEEKLSDLEERITDKIDELSGATDSAITAINEDIEDITNIIEDLTTIVSANTSDIEELKEKIGEGGYITRDITFINKSGETETIYSGTPFTDAIEQVAQDVGGGGTGDGKVKDILVNGESILDEETGIASLVIEGDEDISAEISGGTVFLEIKGISNGSVNLQ